MGTITHHRMPPNTVVCRLVAWRLKIGAGSTVRKSLVYIRLRKVCNLIGSCRDRLRITFKYYACGGVAKTSREYSWAKVEEEGSGEVAEVKMVEGEANNGAQMATDEAC